MGVTKAAGDAMALVEALQERPHEVTSALADYDAARSKLDAAVVEHARKLGAYLAGSRNEEARRHHPPDAVMREIAITRDFG